NGRERCCAGTIQDDGRQRTSRVSCERVEEWEGAEGHIGIAWSVGEDKRKLCSRRQQERSQCSSACKDGFAPPIALIQKDCDGGDGVDLENGEERDQHCGPT